MTVEKSKDSEAFIRAYILDLDYAEMEFHNMQYQDGDISSHASIISINSNTRK